MTVLPFSFFLIHAFVHDVRNEPAYCGLSGQVRFIVKKSETSTLGGTINFTISTKQNTVGEGNEEKIV
jgi:hypothetical protein